MSQLDKLKSYASTVGIDFDELLAELQTKLVTPIAETVRETVGKVEGATTEYVDKKFAAFQESLAQTVQAKVDEGLQSVIDLVEKAKAAQETQPAAGNGNSPSNSNDGGGVREQLLLKGLGILEVIIQNQNPLTMITRVAEFRRAIFEQEPPGVSPDVQANLAGRSFLAGLTMRDKAKTAPLVERRGGTSAGPSREASRPSRPAVKSLRDVVREIG